MTEERLWSARLAQCSSAAIHALPGKRSATAEKHTALVELQGVIESGGNNSADHITSALASAFKDEHSAGASEAGAAEYIDFLAGRSSELAAIFNGGFGWLDTYMHKTYGADFLTAKPEQQTAWLTVGFDLPVSNRSVFFVHTKVMAV